MESENLGPIFLFFNIWRVQNVWSAADADLKPTVCFYCQVNILSCGDWTEV